VNELGHFSYHNLCQLLENGSTHLYQPKTNHYRELYITDKNKKLLKKAIKTLPEVFLNNNVSLLSDEKGNKLGPKHVIKTINQLLKPFSLKYKINLKSHSFRIGLVTNLFQKNVPSTTVQEILGHKDLASTLRYNRYKSTKSEKLEALTKIH